ncbi:MAG: hypothetical protein ACJATF_004421, partial [Flavobacteriales bacterium]
RTGDLSLIVRSSNSMKIIASTLFFSSSSLFLFPSRFQ